MPIYEYGCYDCRKIVSIFTRSMKDQVKEICPICQGANLKRRISRVVIAKGSRRVLEDVDQSRLVGDYGGMDKGSQAAWARKVARELGEAGEEFREMADKVDAGEDVWDLYDPAPMLNYKLEEKKAALSGDGGSDDFSD